MIFGGFLGEKISAVTDKLWRLDLCTFAFEELPSSSARPSARLGHSMCKINET